MITFGICSCIRMSPKWRSLFNSLNYYGDESTQVDGFDTQNISSIFCAFEAFLNKYNPSE